MQVVDRDLVFALDEIKVHFKKFSLSTPTIKVTSQFLKYVRGRGTNLFKVCQMIDDKDTKALVEEEVKTLYSFGL